MDRHQRRARLVFVERQIQTRSDADVEHPTACGFSDPFAERRHLLLLHPEVEHPRKQPAAIKALDLSPLNHRRRGGGEATSAKNDASEAATGAAGDEEQMTQARRSGQRRHVEFRRATGVLPAIICRPSSLSPSTDLSSRRETGKLHRPVWSLVATIDQYGHSNASVTSSGVRFDGIAPAGCKTLGDRGAAQPSDRRARPR